jgi:hypothetical protein
VTRAQLHVVNALRHLLSALGVLITTFTWNRPILALQKQIHVLLELKIHTCSSVESAVSSAKFAQTMPLARLVFLITVLQTRNATLQGHVPKASLTMELTALNVP